MVILKGILKESKDYYLKTEKEIKKKLSKLPQGTIKKRIISGKVYYYRQQRVKDKVVHKYLGKKVPENLVKQIKQRTALKKELKKVREALKLLRKT